MVASLRRGRPLIPAPTSNSKTVRRTCSRRDLAPRAKKHGDSRSDPPCVFALPTSYLGACHIFLFVGIALGKPLSYSDFLDCTPGGNGRWPANDSFGHGGRARWPAWPGSWLDVKVSGLAATQPRRKPGRARARHAIGVSALQA